MCILVVCFVSLKSTGTATHREASVRWKSELNVDVTAAADTALRAAPAAAEFRGL